MKKLVLPNLVISCFVVLSLFSTVAANGNTSDMPMLSIGIMGAFDPNHLNSDNGYGFINNKKDGEIQVLGHTKAKYYVDTIGVKVHLQMWTGSA